LGFVYSQGAPKLRSIEQSFLLGEIEGFEIEYGEPSDCELDCVYTQAWGLRVGSKIGWLKVYESGGLEPEAPDFYDVEANDPSLFDATLWDSMEKEKLQSRFLWSHMMPVIARDEDTPLPALYNLAWRLVNYYIGPYVAEQLLDNPNVQATSGILAMLVELPVYQGDPYGRARAYAEELLDSLESG